MRTVCLNRPAAAPSPQLARMTRHLAARLQDFGPGGPQVLDADQTGGSVRVLFPGRDTAQVLRGLECAGVHAAQEGEAARFFLDPSGRFEDLDYVWGCLFELL